MLYTDMDILRLIDDVKELKEEVKQLKSFQDGWKSYIKMSYGNALKEELKGTYLDPKLPTE